MIDLKKKFLIYGYGISGKSIVKYLKNRNSKYQRNHGIWWNHRAERTDNPLTSKNSIIDNAKEDYKRQLITHVSRSGPTLYSVKDGQVYEGSTYALRRFPKIYRYKVD